MPFWVFTYILLPYINTLLTNLHFPFFSFHSSQSFRFTGNNSSANFLIFPVHVCPSLRSCTIFVISVFSWPLFFPMIFPSNLPIFQYCAPVFQYYIPIKQLPVSVFIPVSVLLLIPYFAFLSETVSLVLFFRFTIAFSVSRRRICLFLAVFPSGLGQTVVFTGYNSTHTTQHGRTLYCHNSTRHNSTRPQLDTPQLYTATTRHATTLHRPYGRKVEATIE